MAYLVRKIVIKRWPDGKNTFFQDINSLQADAVSDLVTKNNTLSWWKIDDLTQIEEVGLSVISKLNDGTERIYLIALPYETLNSKFKLAKTPDNGETAIPKMKENHYDICELNYESLGILSSLIAQETSAPNSCLIRKMKVKPTISKFKELIEAGKVDYDMLGKYLKEKLA